MENEFDDDDERHCALQLGRAKTVFDVLINSVESIVERQQRLSRMSPLDRYIYDKLQNDRAKAVIEGMLIADQIDATDDHTKAMNRLIVENLDADSIWAFAHLAPSITRKSIFDDPTASEANLQAREYAHKRHNKDPKQADKAVVRECWDDWQKHPQHYKGKAAFARDMREKFPNLESQAVIERWCRTWERET